MLKKLISTITILFLSISISNSEISLGIKGGYAELEGTDKTSNTLNKKSGKEDSEYGALFIEGSLPVDLPIKLKVGLEYIPIEAVIDGNNVDNHDGAGDYEMTVKDHTTLYLHASKDVQNDFEIFGKIGYVQADISNVKSTTTLTSKDSKITGATFGIGVQKNLNLPYLSFVRAGYDYIDYDSVEAKSSEQTYTADGEVNAFYLSVGKTF